MDRKKLILGGLCLSLLGSSSTMAQDVLPPFPPAEDLEIETPEVETPDLAEQLPENEPDLSEPGDELVPGEEGLPDDAESVEEEEDGPPIVKARVVGEEPVEEEETSPAPGGQATPPNATTSGNPEKDLFEFGEDLMKGGFPNLAIQKYTQYLNAYHRGTYAAEALFGLAEAYRASGDRTQAETQYRRFLNSHANHELAGDAAYRLGFLTYEAADYRQAISLFESAKRKSEKDIVQVASTYYQGRSYQAAGNMREAERAFQAVVDHPSKVIDLQDHALLLLARLDVSAERNDIAYEKFKTLSEPEEGRNGQIRAEAITKTGIIASRLEDYETSNSYFHRILEITAEEALPWRPAALAGLLENLYKQERYQEMIDAYRNLTDRYRVQYYNDQSEANVLLMVANAHRKLSEFRLAVSRFDEIARRFPETPAAREAAYRKLLTLHQNNDRTLNYYVDVYLEEQRRLGSDHEYFHMANLLKAEGLFARKEYKGAADSYSQIDLRKIPEIYHSKVLYKRGWSLLEDGRTGRAAESFTLFLRDHSDSELVPNALAKRAECYKRDENFQSAIRDYDRLLEEFPDHENAQLAIQQKALIRVQQGDPQGIIESFQALLAKYPDTKAAAEAHYFIGKTDHEQKRYKEAIPSLKKAREMDSERYGEPATSRIIPCYYLLGDVENTAEEVDRVLLSSDGSKKIPPTVLTWLGAKFFDREDFAAASLYLKSAADFETPENTEPVVWNYLGRSLLRSGKFEESITPFDHYLTTVTKADARAKVLLNKANALNQIAKHKEAQKCVEEALSLQKQGRTNAHAWILSGDIAFAQGKYEEASKCYIIPARLFQDPQITPEALYKAALTFDKLNDSKSAAENRRLLQDDWPNYTPDDELKDSQGEEIPSPQPTGEADAG